MQESTGRFLDDKAMREFYKDPAELARKMVEAPRLGIGEVVAIKGVDFRVIGIKPNGKLRLKMCVKVAA